MADRDLYGFADGSTVYPIMLRAMALRIYGNYVSGVNGVVTEQSTPAMGITISTRDVYENGSDAAWNVGGNHTIGTAHTTLDRYDLVVADLSATTGAVVAGTAAANPTVPDMGEVRDIPLAIIWVKAGATAIYNEDIIEVRA